VEYKKQGNAQLHHGDTEGRYVGLLSAASEQTVDQLNTVLPTTVTASDYAKFMNCLLPEEGVFHWEVLCVTLCFLVGR
jgi:hypothetical protein